MFSRFVSAGMETPRRVRTCWALVFAVQAVIAVLVYHYVNLQIELKRPVVQLVALRGSAAILNAQLSNITQIPTSHATVLCPELQDIPSLKNITQHLGKISMGKTEKLVLGETRGSVNRVVEEGNMLTKKLLRRARGDNTTVAANSLHTALSPLETIVGNFSYTPGGQWKPINCKAKWKVAILIPFRNRSVHLPILLRYLVPMLQKQLLHFAIYVVNQENDLPFNRAMLFNVGFLESLKFTTWDCFILHDVDHVPLSQLNPYGCINMPRRLLSGSDRWNYTGHYQNFFGGVSGLTRANIWRINGFPNVYWGWGGEDDEIYMRLIWHENASYFARRNPLVTTTLFPITTKALQRTRTRSSS